MTIDIHYFKYGLSIVAVILLFQVSIAQSYYSKSVDLGYHGHDEIENFYYNSEDGVYFTASSAIENKYPELFVQLHEVDSISKNIKVFDDYSSSGDIYESICKISEDTFAIFSKSKFKFYIKYIIDGNLSQDVIEVESPNHNLFGPILGSVHYINERYYLLGRKSNFLFLSVINKQGEEVFYKEYFQPTSETVKLRSIQDFYVLDNGQMKIIYTAEGRTSTYGTWMMTLDSDGMFIKKRRYGDRLNVTSGSISSLHNETLYLSWLNDNYRDMPVDSLNQFAPEIMAIDKQGNLKWHSSPDDEVYFGITALETTEDGGIIATGITDRETGQGVDISALWKIDNTGETQWVKYIWDERHETRGYSGLREIVQLENGDLFLAGEKSDTVGSGQSGERNTNLWFVRLDENGNCFGDDCPTIKEELTVETVNKNFYNNSISIYPNPADDFVTISSEKIYFNRTKIFDIGGSKVKEVQFTKTRQEQLDVSNLNQGIYFLLVMNNDQLVLKEKLILK